MNGVVGAKTEPVSVRCKKILKLALEMQEFK